MERNFLLVMAIVWNCALAMAQPYWKALGRGTVLGREVQTIFGDDVMDRLLIGGTFLEMMNENDTILGVGQAAWNGSRWDSLAHRIQPIAGNGAAQTFWFVRFQGDLLACGNFPMVGYANRGFGKLNETNMRWEPLACLNPPNAALSTLVPKEPQGSSIYATGFSTSICGYPTASVYRYDGTAFHEWEPWSQIAPAANNYAGLVFDFQGQTYVSGYFPAPDGSGIRFFMRFNGTTWEDIPGWNNARVVKEILIQDDLLYVAGTFLESEGAPGNAIAVFDGTTWNNMDGGLTLAPAPNSVAALTMQWYHGKLYVGGQFDHAGGVPLGTGGMAVWDGETWSSMPGQFYTSPTQPNGAQIADITVWRDSLYICGSFQTVDDQPVRQVAQYIGGDEDLIPVGLSEERPKATFTLSPNPTNGPLRLQGLPPSAQRVVVRDALGRVVHVQAPPAHQLELGHLPAGTYLLQALDVGGTVRGQARFVRY